MSPHEKPAPPPPRPPHLVALIGADDDVGRALAGAARDASFRLHPLPADRVAERLAALEPLGFAGAVVLPADAATDAFAALATLPGAARPSLDAAEAGAADTWTATPGGLQADLAVGRGLAAWLERQRWAAAGSHVAVVGHGPLARAAARELGSLGVAEVAVLGPDRPRAEASLPALPAGGRGYAHALGAPDAAARLRRADLVVRIDAAPLPEECYGPHLALVDLVDEPLSRARARAVRSGAMTANRFDLIALRLAEALRTVLGVRVDPEPFLGALHGPSGASLTAPSGGEA